jgi:hypothetical protein
MPVYAQPMATFPVRNAATIKLIPTRLERPIGGPTGLAGEGFRCRSIGASAWASSAAAHRRPPPVSGTYETSGILVLACFNPQWPNLIFGARFGVRFSNRGYLAVFQCAASTSYLDNHSRYPLGHLARPEGPFLSRHRRSSRRPMYTRAISLAVAVRATATMLKYMAALVTPSSGRATHP